MGPLRSCSPAHGRGTESREPQCQAEHQADPQPSFEWKLLQIILRLSEGADLGTATRVCSEWGLTEPFARCLVPYGGIPSLNYRFSPYLNEMIY